MKYLVLVALGLALWFFWRKAGAASQAMSPADAAKLLGVPARASADDILAAHKRLIAKVHPDAGGSAELAARVNQARDILLNHLTN